MPTPGRDGGPRGSQSPTRASPRDRSLRSHPEGPAFDTMKFSAAVEPGAHTVILQMVCAVVPSGRRGAKYVRLRATSMLGKGRPRGGLSMPMPGAAHLLHTCIDLLGNRLNPPQPVFKTGRGDWYSLTVWQDSSFSVPNVETRPESPYFKNKHSPLGQKGARCAPAPPPNHAHTLFPTPSTLSGKARQAQCKADVDGPVCAPLLSVSALTLLGKSDWFLWNMSDRAFLQKVHKVGICHHARGRLRPSESGLYVCSFHAPAASWNLCL